MHGRRWITSLLIIPVFLICIFWDFGQWLSALVAGGFFVLARAELYALMGIRPKRSLLIWQSILGIFFFLFLVQHQFAVLLFIAFLFFWGSCAITMSYPLQGCRYEMSAHGCVLIYLLFPLACFIYLRTLPYGPSILFFMLSVAIFTDVGGFYGGMFFGRHRMSPTISPKKTWEGAVVGTLTACAAMAAVAYVQSLWWGHSLWIPQPHTYLPIIIVTVIMSAIGQMGDLCESAMKRDAGVKDSGSSLTGHGGFLDMADAMLWIGPAMLVYIEMFKNSIS